MHLIDNVDLVFSCGGRIGDLLPDFTDVVHTVVGCGIDLDDVHGSARSDGLAGLTLPAGISVHGMLTVDGLCQNLGYACLSGTSGPTKKIGVANTVRHDLIFQCFHNMVLTLHRSEGVRTEFTI